MKNESNTCIYFLPSMDLTAIFIVIGIILLSLCIVCCFIQCRRSNAVLQDRIV